LLHSALGYRSPNAYELAGYATVAARLRRTDRGKSSARAMKAEHCKKQ
jgi:hypothetical protein